MTPTPLDALVAALVQARRSGRPVPAQPVPDAASAYAAQQRVADALGWFADSPALVWKSGGPAREAVLTHAALVPAGVWRSPAHSGEFPFHLRLIEAEVALRLGADVDAALAARLDPAGASARVDALCVSIEVVDSRWSEGLAAPALAKLADQQSHGALVLGDWIAFETRDWAAQTCRVRIGQAPERVFIGSHPLADPTFVLVPWLRHATRAGGIVRAGTVVTTGSWCGMLDAQPGDTVHVAFDGIGEARLSLGA